MSFDPDDSLALPHQPLDDELLSQFGASCNRSIHQQLVQHGAPGAVGLSDALVRPRGAADREGTEVEAVGLHRRATRSRQLLPEPPPLECGHAGRMDEVGRERVARERRPVDEQHVVALAGEQHRGRCARATGPHHDGVVAIAWR